MNKKSFKIIVNLFYKPVDELKTYLTENKKVLLPILAGAINNPNKEDPWIKDNCLFDDVGDNISFLNKNINEMTSIYWAYKHYEEIGNPDYIGFFHYRRFFDLDSIENAINEREADIICKKPTIVRSGIISQYKTYHDINDYNILADYLRDRYFDKNRETWFDEFVNMSESIYFYNCNMFVMRKDIFFMYCLFIFPILLDLIPKIDVSNRDNYQKRAVSFLSERLTSMFLTRCMRNCLRVLTLPVIFNKEFKDNDLNERGTF